MSPGDVAPILWTGATSPGLTNGVLSTRLSTNWRVINAPNQLHLLLPDIPSWTDSCNFPNLHRRKPPPDSNTPPGWLLHNS